jgi:hypothetical protein
MISRNISQRLKRPEARTMPAGVPTVMEIVFVTRDGVVTDTLLVEIPQRAHNEGARDQARTPNTYR